MTLMLSRNFQPHESDIFLTIESCKIGVMKMWFKYTAKICWHIFSTTEVFLFISHVLMLFQALMTDTCIFLLVRKCDKFPVPTNGVIKGGQCDNTDYLSSCELICNTGYELSGNGKRTCVINAANTVVWSGSDVQCRRKFRNVKSRLLNSISVDSKWKRVCLTN